jgi:hypothetical protein
MQFPVSLPTAAEMALCARDPARKHALRAKIDDYFTSLRKSVIQPPRGDLQLIKKYGEAMGCLRDQEEASRNMLEAFSRGDARGVREACARIVRR